MTKGSARTDQAPQLPNKEVFPTHQADPKDGILAGPPAEPEKQTQTPPLERPDTSEFHKPVVNPDQSDDPILKDMQILEYNRFERPVEFAKGDKVPPKTQEALDALDPATAQLVKEAGLSDGTALSGNEKGIHIETGKPVNQADADFRAIVRKFGDDPDGPKVDTKPDGSRVYPAPDGVKIMQRSDKQGGMTIEIQVPSAVDGRKLHMIKRRYK